MAPGGGKAVVKAMLIVWHSANKAIRRRVARFTNRFLIVAEARVSSEHTASKEAET